MTPTTSKLGADMLTVPRDLLQDLIDDVADYAVSRAFKDSETTWRSDLLKRARALLARQPAAIDRQGAAIRDRARRFLSEFVRQTGISMSDHVQEVMLNLFLRYAAPLANEASKPAAPPVEQDERGAKSEKLAAFEKWFSEHRDDDFGCGLSKRSAWIVWEGMWQARAASTSANVAQGAEVVSDDHAAVLWRLARMTDAGAWTAELRKAIAPPAQTALTDDARDAARWRIVEQTIPTDDLHDIAVIVAHEAGAFVGNAMLRTPADLIDAAQTAAQSASEVNHAG